MKTSIFCFYFFLIKAISYSQIIPIIYADTMNMDQIYLITEQYYEDSIIYELKGSLPKGNYIVYDSEELNKILVTGSYNSNSRKDSIWNYYDMNGELIQIEVFDNGERLGVINYKPSINIKSSNPKISTRVFYIGQDSSANYLDFDDAMHLISNWSFYKGQSEITHYYPNGLIEYSGSKVDGKRENIWTYYSPDGIIDRIEMYKNDVLLYTINW